MLRLLALLIIICTTTLSAYAEITGSADEPSSETPAEPTEQKAAPEKKTKVDKAATTGLYLGQIVAIDAKGRYLFIRPSAQMEGPRQTFYIDKSTIYRRANKKSTLEDFSSGEKVGIRYLLHDSSYLAIGVFFIDGDTVDLADVKMPPGYKR